MIIDNSWESMHKKLENELRNSLFQESASAHSPAEEQKLKLHDDFFNLEKIRNFKRFPISMGTLNRPDRLLDIFESYYDDDSLVTRIFNTVKLIRRYFQAQYFSLKIHKTIFPYRTEPSVGNERRFSLPNNYLSDSGIRHSYYSNSISKFSNLKSVLEIGAGFGGLASALLEGNKISKYFIVDLPENLLLEHFFLAELGFNVLPWSHYCKDTNQIDCVVLMNGNDLVELDEEVDLLINTMSMQHMSRKNLDFYFNQIGRIEPKKLYLVNRNTTRDQSDIPIENYPIPRGYIRNSFKTCFSSIHFEALFELKINS